MKITKKLAVVAGIVLTVASANAALISEYGILDLTANGGINPNTGIAWADGDQYRLAFHTLNKFTASSTDSALYNARVTAEAQLNAGLTGSTWFAMISTTTTNARVNTGTNGAAGVAVFAMDGTSAIARNNADIWDGWSNPFATDPTGLTGNSTVRTGTVYYSPFLNQHGNQTFEVDVNHGVKVWTGSTTNGTAVVGQEAGSVGNTNTGNTNANNATRVWNRGNESNLNTNSYYALSEVLTVTNVVPEPSSTALLGLGGLALILRRRR